MKYLLIITLSITIFLSCQNQKDSLSNNVAPAKFDSIGKIAIKAGDGSIWNVKYYIEPTLFKSFTKIDLENIRDLCYQESQKNAAHFQTCKPDTSNEYVIYIKLTGEENGQIAAFYSCLASNSFGVIDKVLFALIASRNEKGVFTKTQSIAV